MEAMVWVRDVLQPLGNLGKADALAGCVVEALTGFLTDTGVPEQVEAGEAWP